MRRRTSPSIRRYWPTLHEVSKALNSNLNLSAVLDLTLKSAVEAMNVKACSIRLLDEKKQRLELATAHGLSDAYLKKGPVEVEKSLVDREALQGKSVAIIDVTKDGRWQYPEEARREGIRSVLCVPLLVRDKAVGAIRVYTSKPHRFRRVEVEFLSDLASHAAIAIENARLQQKLQKRLRDFTTLFEVGKTITSSLELQDVLNSIVKSAVEAMNVKACSIRLLDEKKQRLELATAHGLSDAYLKKGPVEVEKSLVDREALQGKSVAIIDVTKDGRWQYPEEARREGIRSVLCAPLSVRSKVIGTIRVYTAEFHEFDEDEVRFLSALSSYAAIAIENARLYDRCILNYEELMKDMWKWYEWGRHLP